MITCHIPRDSLLNANQRLHWRPKADRTATLRSIGYVGAHQLIWSTKDRPTWVGAMEGTNPYPFPHKVRAVVEVLWPNARRRDADNIRPTIKALIDGMVTAGLLEDDDDQHLIGPDLRPVEERCHPDLAVTLRFHFEDAR